MRSLTNAGLVSRMLKKSIHGLFQRRGRKTRFPSSFIFNGLRSLKMDALPCVGYRETKNAVFQQLVEPRIQAVETTQRHTADAVVRQAGA